MLNVNNLLTNISKVNKIKKNIKSNIKKKNTAQRKWYGTSIVNQKIQN